MKKAMTILLIGLIAISCKKNESSGNTQDLPQKVACSESEAFSFAKKNLENSLSMEITGKRTYHHQVKPVSINFYLRVYLLAITMVLMLKLQLKKMKMAGR